MSAGAGVGLAAALMLVPDPGTGLLLAASAGGALGALLLVLLMAAVSGFGAEKLLLSGIALGCMGLAILSAVFAAGGPGSFRLLAWMSGSTNKIGATEAWILAACALVLLLPIGLTHRWLNLLPLGPAVSGALGVPVAASQLVLTLLAALMTGVAAFFVGPLSLVGLIAPHLARLTGLTHGNIFVFSSALIGALVLLLADWLARMIAFPYRAPDRSARGAGRRSLPDLAAATRRTPAWLITSRPAPSSPMPPRGNCLPVCATGATGRRSASARRRRRTL
ncbi:iron chelate uptake ABC transporter family permease subunit [Ancylobacter dichloromethanicus]